jgi:predicted MPP superfamily phosphohydrolase
MPEWRRRSELKAWPILGVLIVQALLCLAHWFLYDTWIAFWWPLAPAASLGLRIVLILLSVIFIVAALLGFRYTNWLVAFLYQIAAVWLGLVNFFFVSACLAWIIDFVLRFFLSDSARLQARHEIAAVLFAAAILVAVYGILNARVIRVRRIPITLEKLPDSWHGRSALVISDLHLGNINGIRFARRIAGLATRLAPDVIFFPGDLYDGTKADPSRIAEPLFELDPPFGVFFVSGNHEEFGGSTHYSEALHHAGFHVLDNERVVIDGLQIVGVHYTSSNYPLRLRSFLTNLRLSDGPASILLQHVPDRLPIVEQAGVSLQLSGHTHGGQIFPFSWVTRRAFGKFTHGLQRFGSLQVLTSSGVGTWGPPMRVGTHSEVVLLIFE